MRLVLGGCKISGCPLLARMLKVYIEALTRFSHVQSIRSQQQFNLSRLCHLNGSKDKKWGEEPLIALDQL